MVTCLVCKKAYQTEKCPRCEFPMVEIVGDYETGYQKIKPEIIAYRKDFFKSVHMSVVVYRWRDDGGKAVPDKEECIPFGTAADMLGQERWIEQKFARIPDVKEINISVCIQCGEDEKRIDVAVPNLTQAKLHQVGATITEEGAFRVLLKSDAETAESQVVHLFDEL